jgi:hypothetical protein
MADQAYIAIAAQYASEDEAVADFEKIHEHYKATDKHGSFDAAVIRRDVDGKLSMPKRDDDGKHRGAGKGLAIGLAGGLAVALFPAVALGGALVVAGGSGAGIGALAGHISRKTPSKDLEAISETLDAGSAGVVAVVDPSESATVQGLLTNATRVTVKDLAVDDAELDAEVDEAYE